MKKSALPTKRKDVVTAAEACISLGRFRFTAHAFRRMNDAGITVMEVRHVIKHGERIPKRDRYSEDYEEWRYLFEGLTPGDEKRITVIVTFEEADDLLIITAFESIE